MRAKKELSCETANMEMDGFNATAGKGRPKRTLEQITVYEKNPYIKSASEKGIILHENFYIEAYSLMELGIDTVLSIFGIKCEKISKAEKRMIAGLIDYYAVNADNAESVAMVENYHPFAVDDTMLMIMEHRMAATNHLVEERLDDIKENIQQMTTYKRKEICFMLSQLPEDPWNIFTAKRIAELCGISRSSYYSYIGNERYGLSAA